MIVTVVASMGIFIAGAGAGASGIVVFWRLRRKNVPTQVLDGLTDVDRDAVARDFAVHVSAVQQKVSEFANALADGDAELRDRLRHFENGGGRS